MTIQLGGVPPAFPSPDPTDPYDPRAALAERDRERTAKQVPRKPCLILDAQFGHRAMTPERAELRNAASRSARSCPTATCPGHGVATVFATCPDCSARTVLTPVSDGYGDGSIEGSIPVGSPQHAAIVRGIAWQTGRDPKGYIAAPADSFQVPTADDLLSRHPHLAAAQFLGPQDVSSEHCPACDETRRDGGQCPVHERQAGAVAAAIALSWGAPSEADKADAEAIALDATTVLRSWLKTEPTPGHLAGAADFFHALAHALHGVAAGLAGVAAAEHNARELAQKVHAAQAELRSHRPHVPSCATCNGSSEVNAGDYTGNMMPCPSCSGGQEPR